MFVVNSNSLYSLLIAVTLLFTDNVIADNHSQQTKTTYKVDFNREEEKAKRMNTDSLFGALKDAIEASQVSTNEGKYFDQLSVYRKELINAVIIQQFPFQPKFVHTNYLLHNLPNSLVVRTVYPNHQHYQFHLQKVCRQDKLSIFARNKLKSPLVG